MKPLPSIFFLIALLFCLTGVLLAADGPSRPTVGAIRWDGWYGEGGVAKEMEHSLGQPKYHFRLPWFATIATNGTVRINGDSQAVMEQEIAYAAEAGLNYWAFVDYGDQSSSMHLALDRYLATPDKKGIRYCFVEEGPRLDGMGVKAWGRLVEHFRRPDYQTVLDGRPLLFVFVKSTTLRKPQWDELKSQCIAASVKPPYLVLMGWNPAQDAKDMEALGFDAISAYARGGSYSMNQPAYAEQCAMIRKERWDTCAALKLPCVTFASAGWDTRPRNERPPSWMKKEVPATPDPTPAAQQKPLLDAVTATPEQLAAHVREAIDWTRAHRDLNPANTVILYGWNEHDEGGWIQPTRGADGRPDERRIRA
ncbi:MAG TPA: glycoside hydrolase family 99-like domain-containing protein, partial [Roseimicrobium sp.]|nr:glycoside hydrolase family 99-like domain-containing protein [Roseimicrobium sp.]